MKRLLDFGEEVGSKEEVVRMVVEAGGVDEAVELAQAHANTALDAVEGWEGEQVEELRELVGQVIGQVEARYDQLFLPPKLFFPSPRTKNISMEGRA